MDYYNCRQQSALFKKSLRVLLGAKELDLIRHAITRDQDFTSIRKTGIYRELCFYQWSMALRRWRTISLGQPSLGPSARRVTVGKYVSTMKSTTLRTRLSLYNEIYQ